MNVADDGNVPTSSNACIAGTCSGGVPGNTLLPAETACGAGLVCDGAGSCVGCLSDADCGTSNACATYRCVGSTRPPAPAPRAARCRDHARRSSATAAVAPSASPTTPTCP
jgi:hypothetical protein